MEIKQIKELMAAMGRCGTTKLHIKKGSFELEIQRGDLEGENPRRYTDEELEFEEGRPSFKSASRRGSATLPRAGDMAAALNASETPPKPEAPGTFITSPMVGTFYSAPSPEDSPFVKVGDTVEKGMVVCVIEAMKVMNEIKAQSAGTIVEVLVDNGHPVEFGTKLFRIQ